MDFGQLKISRIEKTLRLRVFQTKAPFQSLANEAIATGLTLRIFYLYFVYMLLSQMNSYHNWISGIEDGLWPTLVLQVLGANKYPLFTFSALIAATISPVFFLGKKWAHIFAFLGIIALCSFNEKLHFTAHQTHVWILTALAFALSLPSDAYKHRIRDFRIVQSIDFARALFLSVYFLTGLQKVLAHLHCRIFYDQCTPINRWLDIAISGQHFMMKTFSPWGPHLWGNEFLNVAGAVTIIFFQLSVIMAVFNRKLIPVAGLGVIAFHTSTKLVLDIGFHRMMYCGIIVFILPWIFQTTLRIYRYLKN